MALALGSLQFRAQRRVAILLITLTSVFSLADRHILSVVLEPIKAEFHLSDTELGLLSGFAFSAFYATCGLPLAWLADRVSRRWLTASALAVFSLMTALSGMATSFLQLFLTRMGVGIGEAGTGPAGQSMIADYYPPERRTFAMSLLALGATVGTAAGLIVGGSVSGQYGWRAAFLAVGLPGLILAFIILVWLREAPRGYSDGRTTSTNASGLVDAVAYVWSNPAARHLIVASVLYNVVTFAFTQWAPTYFIRVLGLTPGEAGPLLGGVVGVIGAVGILVGGAAAQRLENIRAAYGVWMVAATTVVAAPLAAMAFLATSVPTAVAYFCVPVLVGNFFVAPTLSLMQGLAPVRMRATTAAIVLFANAVVGGIAGPAFVGILSDALHATAGDDSLRYSLIAVVGFWLWAAFHFVLCGRNLDKGLALAREREGG